MRAKEVPEPGRGVAGGRSSGRGVLGALAWALVALTPGADGGGVRTAGWPAWLAQERAEAANDGARLPRLEGRVAHLDEAAAHFDERGATVACGRDGAGLAIRLAAVRRVDRAGALAAAAPRIAGPEVRLPRGPGVTEWWRSLPSGLEHGVNLDERPAGSGPLTLEVDVGEAWPEPVDADEVVLLDGPRGAEVARYGRLAVLDADLHSVPASLTVAGNRIRIVIDDERARYPLIVDPLLRVVHEATIDDPGAGGTGFGSSLALSTDGTRLVSGAPDEGGAVGALYVHVRTGTTWTLEARLTASSPVSVGGNLGQRVAVSSDGSRLAATTASGVLVFARTGAIWTEDGYVSSAGSSPRDVALSQDGLRLLVGQGLDRAVVHRRDATWVWETNLLPPGASAGAAVGASVAFSNDGARAFVGAPNDSSVVGPSAGSVRVFARSGSSWTYEAALRGEVMEMLGSEVAAGGTRMLARGGRGLHVYAHAGGAWTEDALLSCGAAVVAADLSAGDDLIATSSAVGQPGCLFRFDGAAWPQISPLPSGTPVALTPDGRRVALRAPSAVEVHRIEPGAAAGTACGAGSACLSDVCVDGVCCATACEAAPPAGMGAGPDLRCQACAEALTGLPDGTCAPRLPGHVCRPSAGTCDLEETCSGAAMTCPPDALSGAGTTCRAAAGACDAAERCDGLGAACPADALLSGAECRAAAGSCDVTEVCSGTSTTCPPDGLIAAGVACRVATHPSCDPVEACDGVSASCPADRTTCEASDGGASDAAPPGDGAAALDAGTAASATTGCACRARCAPRASPSALVAALVTLGACGRAGARAARRSAVRHSAVGGARATNAK